MDNLAVVNILNVGFMYFFKKAVEQDGRARKDEKTSNLLGQELAETREKKCCGTLSSTDTKAATE